MVHLLACATSITEIEDSTKQGATGTDVVAVDQGTAVVAEEDNTTAALDVAAMNASVFRGRKRARRTFCDTTTLTFEKFSEYFYLPSEQAAEELQVKSTVVVDVESRIGLFQRWCLWSV
nr:hypothetical protein Iba_chr15cCG9030 [Ipomoea batatas]